MVVQDISEQGVWAARLDTGQVEVGIYRSDISTVPGSQASVFAPFFWPDKAGSRHRQQDGRASPRSTLVSHPLLPASKTDHLTIWINTNNIQY